MNQQPETKGPPPMNDAAPKTADAAIRVYLATHPFDPSALAMLRVMDTPPTIPRAVVVRPLGPNDVTTYRIIAEIDADESANVATDPGPAPPKPCTCDILALMAGGCRCGGA
jgi:hypothetical protein